MHIHTIQDTGRTIFKTASGAWRYPTATCTKVNESRHICTNCVTLHLHCVLANGHVYEGEWVMSHVWVSSDICTSHVALHVCCWRRWMSHVSHMYEACHTAHVTCASQRWHVWRWMSIGPHIAHMYESCHSDLWQTSLWKFSDISVTWQIYRYHCEKLQICPKISQLFFPQWHHCEKFQISLWHFRDSHIWHMYESCHIEIWLCLQWCHRAKCTSHVLWVMLDVRRYSVEWLVHMGGSDVWESIYHVSRYFLHVSVSHIGHT